MAKVYLEDTELTNIGNAIRAKSGTSGLLLPSEMPSAIEGIQAGGNSGTWKYTTITPTSTATTLNLSPWITDKYVNDWFMIGRFAYNGTLDIVATTVSGMTMGPAIQGANQSLTWPYLYATIEDGATNPNSDFGGKIANTSGWGTRTPTWNATTKILTWADTKWIGKNAILIFYKGD